MAASGTFNEFFDSEKVGGALLIACTITSLAVANSPLGPAYDRVWQSHVAGLSVRDWINDALMAVFFLLVGLELERELYRGELSDLRSALLPIVAAGGGVLLPAAIHFALNTGTPTSAGIAIPMATDIAFALGALALLGSRVPQSLRIFLAALAVIDDLAAIVVIAVFYTEKLFLPWLAAGLGIFGLLLLLSLAFRVMALLPYLVGGALLWLFTLMSGVHATIAGVLLAFAVPFSARTQGEASPSLRLERWLQKPVPLVILPLFALANTAIVIGPGTVDHLAARNGLGIIAGLLVGKPVGIVLGSYVAIAAGLSRLPAELRWRHILGAGFLGGIGFTMSIFIANLAFRDEALLVEGSIVAVLLGSLASALLGYFWLRR